MAGRTLRFATGYGVGPVGSTTEFCSTSGEAYGTVPAPETLPVLEKERGTTRHQRLPEDYMESIKIAAEWVGPLRGTVAIFSRPHFREAS